MTELVCAGEPKARLVGEHLVADENLALRYERTAEHVFAQVGQIGDAEANAQGGLNPLVHRDG